MASTRGSIFVPTPPRDLDAVYDEFQTLSAALALDPWHYVGEENEPSFSNSWVNYDTTAGFTRAAFRINPFGMVTVRGRITGGSTPTSIIFNLPPDYRPVYDFSVIQDAYDGTLRGPMRIFVSDNGNVILIQDLTLTWNTTPDTGYLELNIHFYVDTD